MNVTFYGMKLFSGPILEELNPGGDLIVKNGYLLVYNLVGLVGYYAAAYVIDRPFVGRKRLQMGSFAVLTMLFCLTAGLLQTASPGVLLFLFFISNFFSTFGANTTTYVMAAETYPTELRGTCHGLSAFLGKLGALVATIAFGVIDLENVFWISGGVSAVGVAMTYVFSCDLTGLSLAEHDAQLELLLEDRLDEYKGRLNDPKHLSNFEIWSGRHGEFDPNWARKYVRKHHQDASPGVGGNASVASFESKRRRAESIQEHPGDIEKDDASDLS
jgi:MFS family permease